MKENESHMKNEDLYEFRETVRRISFKDDWGFVKTLFNNLKKVNDAIDIVEKFRPDKESVSGYSDFKKAVESLKSKYVSEPQVAEAEISKLRYKPKHKEFFEKLEDQTEKFNSILKKSSDVELDQFDDEKVLETSGIDANLLFGIRFMLLKLK